MSENAIKGASTYDFNMTLTNVIDTEEEEAAYANMTQTSTSIVASAQKATEKATSK